MRFENPFKPFKDMIDKGLKKITPPEKPETEEMPKDTEKFFEKGPDDYKKEEEQQKIEGKGKEEAEKS